MSKTERKATQVADAYDFGGPFGTFGASVGLPILVYTLSFGCNDIAGCPVPSLLHPSTLTLDQLKKETGWPQDGLAGLFSLRALGWTLAYYFASLMMQAFLPGEEAHGLKLASGGRLKYKFNSFNSAMIVLAGAAIGTFLQGPDFVLWTFMRENFIGIVTSNMIISFLLATFVYVHSFGVKPHNKQHRELALGGMSGNMMYDWFKGRELNPRVDLPIFGTLDIKVFCELRPGLLAWVLFNLSFMARQYKVHGFITDSMILVNLFQALYVMDGIFMESSILSTMDITTDGFGFMLAFGDLAWVPFVYSIQARYLSTFPLHLGVFGIAGVLAVQGVGYYIFRNSNSEKHTFRNNPKDPKVAHLKYMETAAGTKLLVSGWWGRARHINYLGDWIMAWTYCLPTGISGFVVRHGKVSTDIVQGEARGWGMLFTYFYVIYFGILLVHRAARDDERCAKKYGKDWEEYKRLVPYRIIPYVY